MTFSKPNFVLSETIFSVTVGFFSKTSIKILSFSKTSIKILSKTWTEPSNKHKSQILQIPGISWSQRLKCFHSFLSLGYSVQQKNWSIYIWSFWASIPKWIGEQFCISWWYPWLYSPYWCKISLLLPRPSLRPLRLQYLKRIQ